MVAQRGGTSRELCPPGSGAGNYWLTYICRGDRILITGHVSRQARDLQDHTYDG